jgi:hypothetical protein
LHGIDYIWRGGGASEGDKLGGRSDGVEGEALHLHVCGVRKAEAGNSLDNAGVEIEVFPGAGIHRGDLLFRLLPLLGMRRLFILLEERNATVSSTSSVLSFKPS